MICSNCGSQVPEGSKFCQVCGARTAENLMNEAGQTVQNEMSAQTQPLDQYAQPQQQYAQPQQQYAQPQQQYAQPQQQYAQPQQYAQAYAPAAVAKKGLGTGVKVLIAILSVVAVLGIVFAVFSSQIINFFKQMTMSDAEYLQSKTLEATSDFTNLAMLSYEKASGDGTGSELTFDLSVGESLINMLKLSGADFSWFKNIGGNVNLSVSPEYLGGELAVKLNGTVLVTVNMAIEDGKLHISAPELTDKVAVVDIKSLAKIAGNGRSGSLNTDEMTDIIKKLMAACPDPEKTEELIDKYVKVIVESVDNVEKKSDTISVGSLKQNAKLYTATITQTELRKIMKNLLETLRDDADVKKIVDNIAKAVERDDFSYNELRDRIVELIDSVDEIKFEGSVYYKMWLNSSGERLGVSLEGNVEGTEFEVSSKTANDGSDFAYSMVVKEKGQTFMSVEGKGTSSGDKRTGKYLFKVQDMAIMTVELEDFDVEDCKEGYLNGKVSVSFEKDFIRFAMENADTGLSGFGFTAYEGNDMIVNMLSSLRIVCDFDSSSDHFKVEVKIMMGESEYLKAAFEINKTAFKKYSVPAGSKIEVEDQEDLEKWAGEFDISKLVSALKKAGVPDELLDDLN